MHRILIVDDELILRTLMADILNRHDYQTIVAEDGIEALHILETDHAFSLIISDVFMPRMDGIALYEELQQHYPDIPVLMTSVHWTDPGLINVLQNEGVSYLPRPFTARQLLEKVIAIINKFH
jgi:CheY-like chemotaxis protein